MLVAVCDKEAKSLDRRRYIDVLSKECSELTTEMNAMTMTIETPSATNNDGERTVFEKATPAHRLLCVLGDWATTDGVKLCSERARRLATHGYKYFFRQFGDDHAGMVLRASSTDVIEVHTLIAYPDRRGHGTTMMSKLCEEADTLGVRLWLDALPFGANRQLIPLSKLKTFYRSFGFFVIQRPQAHWVNGFHRWEHSSLRNLMLRNPVADPSASSFCA
jgi:GNAT superfamily N-acetyltransferase